MLNMLIYLVEWDFICTFVVGKIIYNKKGVILMNNTFFIYFQYLDNCYGLSVNKFVWNILLDVYTIYLKSLNLLDRVYFTIKIASLR